MYEEEEEVRAPIEPRRMRLIDDDGFNYNNSDSDEEGLDDIQKAINRSLRDVYGNNYEEKKRRKNENKKEDEIINSMLSGEELKKNNISPLENLLNNEEHKDLYEKMSNEFILYTSGLVEIISLDSALYYEVSNLINSKIPNNSSKLFNIIRPLNETEYTQYYNIVEKSKKETINIDAVEMNKRRKTLKPLTFKFKMLRGFDKDARELEEKIKENIKSYIDNKTDKIYIDEEHYEELNKIINSIKNIDERNNVKNLVVINGKDGI
jgi:hypothetical protein